MIYCGVDLGLSGGIIMIDEANEVTYAGVMPVIKSQKSSLYDIHKIIYIFKNYHPMYVMIEKPILHPNVGKKSYHQSGYGLGLFTGITSALSIRTDWVLPKQWQKAVLGDFGKGDSKTASKQYASMNFPHEDFRIGKNYHDGLTDALCIAVYGKMKHAGGLV